MEQELLNLAEITLHYWLKNTYKNIDTFDLYIEIAHLLYQISTTKNTDIQDIKLSNFMTCLERKYSIPLLNIDISNWLQKDNKNKLVLDVYEKVSNLRTI